jgi:hypothetical protein
MATTDVMIDFTPDEAHALRDPGKMGLPWASGS